MSHFSGAVKLADLDDFLGPSQSCVKPLMKPKGGALAASAVGDDLNKLQVRYSISLAGATALAHRLIQFGFRQTKVPL